MARNLFRQNSDGHVVPDFDPNLVIPYETGQVNDNSDLWDVFKAYGDRPMLIVRGALSQNLTSELCETMLAANSMARAVTVDNVGHAPTLAEPIALSAVQDFIKSIQ